MESLQPAMSRVLHVWLRVGVVALGVAALLVLMAR